MINNGLSAVYVAPKGVRYYNMDSRFLLPKFMYATKHTFRTHINEDHLIAIL